jgi:hypothetical protein
MIGKSTQIFPGGSLYVSHSFKLEDDLIKLALVGLQNGDCIEVEYVVGNSDCDEKWIAYSPSCCGQLKFGYPQGEVFLNVPNRYRLRLSNRFGSHLTDPAWFENVEIYQTPVTGTNINLSEGNCGMSGCSADVKCSAAGVTIDGVLCAAPDTKVTSVVPTATGWTLVQNDGTTHTLTLSDAQVNSVLDVIAYSENVTTNLAAALCANTDAKDILTACVVGTVAGSICPQVVACIIAFPIIPPIGG